MKVSTSIKEGVTGRPREFEERTIKVDKVRIEEPTPSKQGEAEAAAIFVPFSAGLYCFLIADPMLRLAASADALCLEPIYLIKYQPMEWGLPVLQIGTRNSPANEPERVRSPFYSPDVVLLEKPLQRKAPYRRKLQMIFWPSYLPNHAKLLCLPGLSSDSSNEIEKTFYPLR
ncbi:hypothetical protein ACH5RR_026691 [Cinchona calisaya]|uniref:Uncharacterized protein n=1 Tax=Cinchona calisaya TaxID=153742 RepID=A0ABD2Z3C2_9GENT